MPTLISKNALSIRAKLSVSQRYDLVKWAKRLGRFDDLKIWNQNFGDVKTGFGKRRCRQHGEIVLIFQQGLSAIKRQNPQVHQFPKILSSQFVYPISISGKGSRR